MRTTHGSTPVARLNRYIGAYFVCHLASYDACALIPFKLFMGFRTLWALVLAGAGYPLWLWAAASPFACRWPAATFCKIKEDAWGLRAVAVRYSMVRFSLSIWLDWWSRLSGKFMWPRAHVLHKGCCGNHREQRKRDRSSIFVFLYRFVYMYEMFSITFIYTLSFVKVFSTNSCNNARVIPYHWRWITLTALVNKFWLVTRVLV